MTAACWLTLFYATGAAADLGPLLRTLNAVGPDGKGHEAASKAWRELSRAEAEQLPEILAAIDPSNPLSANWIRTAADAIAERRLESGGKLPAAELERFVLDTRHAPKARRLAYEWLVRVDRSAPERLLPGMIHDPSLELRRDAVARLVGQVRDPPDPNHKAEAVAVYRQALAAARDLDQVRWLADRLRNLGEPVDLARHFGFVLRWRVIGPFDNPEQKGFDVAYAPEKGIDFSAAYAGKHGEVRWSEYTTTDEYGLVDFNQALKEEKAVIGYAAAEFFSAERREVQLRASSGSSPKFWLNGKLVGQYPIYHAGAQMDQYVMPVIMEPGRNLILVKACQNEQTQDWAREWGFQLRVCTADGTGILSQGQETPK